MTTDFRTTEPWRRNRKLVKSGFRDLAYLPRSRTGWNATLAAYAYSVRQHVLGSADVNLWATVHASPASARVVELGEHALVLWHGTSAARAEKIRTTGLFHKGGLWTTTDPGIAHSFSRGRGTRFDAGSAMVVIVLDRRELEEGAHYEPQGRTGNVLRFFRGLPPETIEWICFDDHIEFTGTSKATQAKPWGVARFKKRHGHWVPRSKPPVRFDDDHDYDTFDAWLDLSLCRIFRTLGSASAIEVFSSLYATVDPWDVLEHETILNAIDRLCARSRQRGKFRRFHLRESRC